MFIIENSELKVSVAEHGAELRAVYDKNLKKDRMWSGDPAYWNRVSPVLFPIVGKLKNGYYLYNDEKYELSQHGFLRDQMFVVESQSDDQISFVFESNDELKNNYPFDYKVRITYRLEAASVIVTWEVENTGSELMYYSIGAHPAFALDKEKDYVFSFEQEGSIKEITLKEGLLGGSKETKLEDIKVEAEAFKNNAIIYEDVDSVVLKSLDNREYVKLNFAGFPFVGLWSPYKEGKMAPFVCIEPWLGIADEFDTNQKITDKKGIMELSSGQSDKHEYEMIFNEG